MKRFVIPTLLVLMGAALLYVGAGTLFFPRAFFEANGASLGRDPSLMSEVRGPGGLLIVSGLVVALGAFREGFAATALALAATVYGAFGGSRLVSLVLDGIPSEPLVGALAFELVVCLAASIAFVRTRFR